MYGMLEGSRCEGCPYRNLDGGDSTCKCVNPESDMGFGDTELWLKFLDLQEREIQESLANLFPVEEERIKWLNTGLALLGGVTPFQALKGIGFSKDAIWATLIYLDPEGRKIGGNERYLSNALGGYLFAEEIDDWLDTELDFFGKTPREIVKTEGGVRAITSLLWYLIMKNPLGKDMPHYRKPRGISPAQREMLLDEMFPKSVHEVAVDSYNRKQNLIAYRIRLAIVVGIIILVALLISYLS